MSRLCKQFNSWKLHFHFWVSSYIYIEPDVSNVLILYSLFLVFTTITVNPLPESVTSVVGATIQYNCTASGYPPPLITWTRDGLDLPQDISTSVIDSSTVLPTVQSVLSLVYVSLADEGSYQCTASNNLVTESNDTSDLTGRLTLLRE